MRNEVYYTYIMSNAGDSVLYIGMTNNLVKRIYEHETKIIDGFTKRYQLTKLVYHEIYDTAIEAIVREKQLKSWSRKKKEVLINRVNPKWKDMSDDL